MRETVRLASPYPPDECKRRIAASAQRKTLRARLGFTTGVFARVNRDGFLLTYRRALVHNSFTPVFDARLEPSGSGSIVSARFRLHRFVVASSLVWLGVFGIVVVAVGVTTALGVLRGEYALSDPRVLAVFLSPFGVAGLAALLVIFASDLDQNHKVKLVAFVRRHLRAIEL